MRDRLSWYSTIVVHTRRSLAYTCATSTSIYSYPTGNRCFMGPCSQALILESSVICICIFGGISFRCLCMSQLPNVHFHHNHCCVNSLDGIVYVCGLFRQKCEELTIKPSLCHTLPFIGPLCNKTNVR